MVPIRKTSWIRLSTMLNHDSFQWGHTDGIDSRVHGHHHTYPANRPYWTGHCSHPSDKPRPNIESCPQCAYRNTLNNRPNKGPDSCRSKRYANRTARTNWPCTAGDILLRSTNRRLLLPGRHIPRRDTRIQSIHARHVSVLGTVDEGIRHRV